MAYNPSMNRSKTQSIGYRAEQNARRFLQRQGLQWIANQYTCYYGEIDLIMKEKDQLVFVEVRYRQDNHYCSAVESIGPTKQQRLIRTASHYLQSHDLMDRMDSRFDVIGIDKKQKILWIKEAFTVQCET